jgi:hypothetical protein
MSEQVVVLKQNVIFRVLLAITVLLVIASVSGQLSKYLADHDQVFGLVPLFNADGDRNIPNVFAVLQFAMSAFLLMIIAHGVVKAKGPYAVQWSILTVIFVLFAIDEAWALHKMLTNPLSLQTRGVFNDFFAAIFYYAWVIVGIAFVGLVGLFFLRFLWALPAATRNIFLLSGGLFVAGAVGVEMICGYYAYEYGTRNLTYNLIANVEEALEMFGLTLFIHGLLGYLREQRRSLSFQFI